MLQKYSRHYVAEHKNDIERWNNYGVVYFFFSFLFGLHLACSIMLLKSLAWDCLSNLILLYASICIIMSYMWPLYIVAFKDIFHFVSVWCVDAFCVDTCMYIYIYLYTYFFFNIIGYTYNLPEKKHQTLQGLKHPGCHQRCRFRAAAERCSAPAGGHAELCSSPAAAADLWCFKRHADACRL
mgnify:CR=1 FL=1